MQHAPPPITLDHCVVHVSDWARSNEFYHRVLGAEVVQIGQEHGYAYWTMLGSSYLAGPDLEAPDRAFLEQVVVTLRAMGQEAFAAFNLGALAELVDAAGDVDAAHDLVGQALQVVQKTGEELHRPDLLRRRAGYTLARGGRPSEAAEDLVAAIEVATERGKRGEADPIMKKLETWLKQTLVELARESTAPSPFAR